MRSDRRPGTTDTRARILTAARQEFATKGFRGATIRSIAGAAGVDVALLSVDYWAMTKNGLIGASDPGLAALPISQDLIGSQVGMTVASGRRLSPAAEAMIDALAEVALTMCDTPSTQ